MDLWKSLEGMMELELLCADPADMLRRITAAGLTLYGARPMADLVTLWVKIRRGDYKKLKALAERRGCSVEILRRSGLYWTGKALLGRPVLLGAMALFLVLSFWLPSRIFFFQVEGNGEIPARQILAACQEAGMGFGSSRRDVRSEKVKNRLLQALPQLQWVGVNTTGCTATVTVRPRAQEEKESLNPGVSSLVALRDGIVISCTASRGNLLCKPGQAVTAGQVLISGYTDCGLSIQATQAQGEVYARTSRDVTVILPQTEQIREETQTQEKKYALIIGKKRINFYKGSGISGGSCGKMYEERYVTLPGGFQLPVIWVTETWTQHALSQQELPEDTAQGMLESHARQYLTRQMVAGAILDGSLALESSGECYILTANYACTEMIGRVRYEEIVKPNGNND